MPATDRKPWPRPVIHEHVLGEVVRVNVGQYQARVLMIYEQSVERNSIPDGLPPLRGRLLGDMDGVRCTICGREVANWHVGEDAMQALLSLVTSQVKG
jgi:hypothetical protein